jgi:hypothetical protein
MSKFQSRIVASNVIAGVIILTAGLYCPAFCEEPEIQHDIHLEMTLTENQGFPLLTVKLTNIGEYPILLPEKFMLCYGRIDCLDANGESLFVPVPQRFPVVLDKQCLFGSRLRKIALLRHSSGRWKKKAIEWQKDTVRITDRLYAQDKTSVMLKTGQNLTQQIQLAKPVREIGLGHGTDANFVHTPLYFESFKSINQKDDWIRVQTIRLEFGERGDTVFGMLFCVDTDETQDDWQYFYSGKDKTVEMTLYGDQAFDKN